MRSDLFLSGAAAAYRTRHQAHTARLIAVEQAADHLATGEQPGIGRLCGDLRSALRAAHLHAAHVPWLQA
jgi:hypothetical protein